MTKTFSIGHGFDVHRLRRGRKLVLGGVPIAHGRGLVGHSDADVVLHALINAILGALGEGDIGLHFPDNDSRYRNIASSQLLLTVLEMMRHKRYHLVNADVTLVAQEPKLSPYYPLMRRRVRELCKIAESCINIKATTTEKLGWVGAGKGIAATAVVLLGR